MDDFADLLLPEGMEMVGEGACPVLSMESLIPQTGVHLRLVRGVEFFSLFRGHGPEVLGIRGRAT